MKLEFDFLPPSSNHAYFRSKNGRMFMSKEGHAFKEQIGWLAKKFTPITGEVRVDLQFTFPDKRVRDSQNLEKLLYDALEGFCYLNDKQIADRRVRRYYGTAPKTIIEIDKLKEQ